MPYVADFNPNVPSIARVYDYFNGGKDNFAANRELAPHLIDIFPPLTVTVRENKQFLDRAVSWAGAGLGLPTPVYTGIAAHGLPCDR